MNQNINTASSAVAKAEENLDQARTDLTEIKATIVELDRAYDSDEELPKGHQSKVDTAQGRLIQLTRAVSRREDALSEARAGLRQAEAQAKADRIDQLGGQLASFDREAWTQEFLEQVQPIVDRHLEQVYELKAAEAELRSLVGGEKYPTDRVHLGTGSSHYLSVDGNTVHPLSPQFMARGLGELLRDTRHEAEVNAVLEADRAEQTARRAEEEAERKAQRDAESIAKWGSVNPPTVVTKTNRDGHVTYIKS